jgi:hypothetical protein
VSVIATGRLLNIPGDLGRCGSLLLDGGPGVQVNHVDLLNRRGRSSYSNGLHGLDRGALNLRDQKRAVRLAIRRRSTRLPVGLKMAEISYCWPTNAAVRFSVIL